MFSRLTSCCFWKCLKNRIHHHPKNLRLIINAAGRLHSDTLNPEKRLQHVDKDNLIESFSINSIAPILLAKTIEEFIPKDSLFNFATISARVGSIGDNKTGGWYSYRCSKAALNMLVKNLSIEMQRKNIKQTADPCVADPTSKWIAVHPATRTATTTQRALHF